MEKCDLQYGLGYINLWGQSHPINFSKNSKVLLIGSGDGRHYYLGNSVCDFWVSEIDVFLYARQILLLAILSERKSADLNIPEIFCEVFGNLKLRQSTYDFSKSMANSILKLLKKARDNEESSIKFNKVEIVLSKLKQQNLDELENILDTWIKFSDQQKAGDYWEKRLRKHLNRRFGCREGVIDMDYEMRFKDKHQSVTLIEYSDWRLKGMAFNFTEDYDHLLDNFSLLTNRNGTPGFWGNIVSSPFFAFPAFQAQASHSHDKAHQRIMKIQVIDYLRKQVDQEFKITFLPPSNAQELLNKNIPSFDILFIGSSGTHALTKDFVNKLGLKEVYIETPLGFATTKNIMKEFKKSLMIKIQATSLEWVDYDADKSFVFKLRNHQLRN